MIRLNSKTKNKGITLIALIITIIILLILAGVAISTLTGDDGLFSRAKDARELTEKATEEEQRKLAMLEAAASLENTTYKGITIPAGFAPTKIEGEDTINDGLAIIDENGNEFVWVPCTSAEYKKGDANWKEYEYKQYNDWTGDPSQEDKNRESVEKYGGFYIARYEAGVPSNASFYVPAAADGNKTYSTNKNVDTYAPVSKKGMQAWNYIDQKNAKTVSEKMYSGSRSVMSRLVDGIAWDTTIEWIAKDTDLSDKVKKDSTTVGNYANNSSTGKITTTNPILWAEHLYSSGWYPATNYRYDAQFTFGYTASYKVPDGDDTKYTGYEAGKTYAHYVEMATGASDNTKLKNIYDLGGNMWEWTTERGSNKATDDNTTTYDSESHAVLRGGSFNNDGNTDPASMRNGYYSLSSTNPHIGFRVLLYVK